MGEENEEKKQSTVAARVGDTIQIKKGKKKGTKAKVLVLRDNSVIVEIGINPKTNEPIKTVVNHKNYKIVK